MDISVALTYLFISSVLVVLCFVCLIQNKQIKEFERQVRELKEKVAKYETA